MQIYKIIQMVNGQMVVTKPIDIVAWAEVNGRATYWPKRSLRLRAELQLEPSISGLCGPMYDGEQNGIPVIRYEDSETNDTLSR